MASELVTVGMKRADKRRFLAMARLKGMAASALGRAAILAHLDGLQADCTEPRADRAPVRLAPELSPPENRAQVARVLPHKLILPGRRALSD